MTDAQHTSVIDYLKGLVWDGTPRLDRWLVDLAGAEDTADVRAISRGMLVAAVRRARHPGCRFDQMPVLVGPQGSGKSAALRVLVGDDWIGDDLPLSDARSLLEATTGKWVVEIGELEGLGESRGADLKAVLSRTHDEARMAYQQEISRVPRQFVIVGTTNETDEYLRSATGNRRFWPVRVHGFDLDRLRSDRDQLWSEAAAIEARGEAIQLDFPIAA